MKNSKPYQFSPSSDFLMIRLTGECEFSSVKQFSIDLTAQMGEHFRDVIINCEHLDSLSADWVREIIKYQSTLKAASKSLRFILAKSDLKKEFKTAGIDSTFKVCANLKDALVDMGCGSKRILDTDFVNPFLTATLHVLNVQANVTAQAGKIYLKEPDQNLSGDISGVIGIVSDNFNGSVVISFPSATFLKVMSGMLGEEYLEVNQEIMDGAGEITNMIFGQAKLVLNEKGYGIKTAIPTVISGKDHITVGMSKGPTVVVPFTSNAGEFFVQICLAA